MPAVHSQTAGLACSENGRWLAWSESGRLRLSDRSKPTHVVELALTLEPPFELAISSIEPERLLILQASGGSTTVRVIELPELREVVDGRLSLRGEAHLVTLCGSVAVLLGGTESLIAVDLVKLRATPIPVRGPIQVVAQVSQDQLLVGARGRIEAWSLAERRPTHRLVLPLPRDAGFGGVISNGRLLWVASTGAPGAVSLFRLSDGKPLAVSVAGGTIKAIADAATSTTVVAAVQSDAGTPLQLVALDLETQAHRVLAFDRPIAAFCLAGAPADAVAVLAEHGPPVLLPFAAATSASPRPILHGGPGPRGAAPEPDDSHAEQPGAAPPDTGDPEAARSTSEASRGGSTSEASRGVGAPTALPAGSSAGESSTAAASALGEAPEAAQEDSNDLAARLSEWRSQVQAAVFAAPPRAAPPSERGLRVISDEPRSRSRSELYTWGQSARARTTTTPPPPPQGWRLNDLAARFKLDMRSRSLLTLLYASWLDGEGRRGVPVGVLARALGNDEDAWVDALAQGRLGRLGWLRSSRGRTRLRGVVGRFLDEASPRVVLVEPTGDAVTALTPPAGPALWRVRDRAAVPQQAHDLANRLGAPVATIDMDRLPATRRGGVLAARLLEARLHGAFPIIVPSEVAAFPPHVLDGPAFIALFAFGTSVLPDGGALPVWQETDGQAPAAELA
jgi:hypothetical protein